VQAFRPIVLAAFLLAGCAHSQVQFNAGAVSSASGGTSITTSGGGLAVQGSGSTAAALIGLGIAGAVIYSAERNSPGGYGVRYNANPFMAVTDGARAPELAPERRVNEQDCTQPIADVSANLKCR
jgi:hypothetical protein